MSAVSPGAMSRLSSGSGDNKPSTATTTTTRCAVAATTVTCSNWYSESAPDKQEQGDTD